jgi:hypothetical protein
VKNRLFVEPVNAQQREIKNSNFYYATRTRPDAGIELALVEREVYTFIEMFHVSIAESLATRLLLRNSSRVAKLSAIYRNMRHFNSRKGRSRSSRSSLIIIRSVATRAWSRRAPITISIRNIRMILRILRMIRRIVRIRTMHKKNTPTSCNCKLHQETSGYSFFLERVVCS